MVEAGGQRVGDVQLQPVQIGVAQATIESADAALSNATSEHARAQTLVECGAVPVPVEADPATLNIDPGPGNLSMDVTRPDGPERSVGFTEYFFYAEVPDETAESLDDAEDALEGQLWA